MNSKISKVFPKKALKKFVVDSVWDALSECTCHVDRPALCNLINSRIDIAFQPLEDWINYDGELDSIIDIVEEINHE